MKLKVVRKKRREEGGKKRRENWGFWNPLEPQNLTLQSAHLGWVVDP
jgi:hypothetical protein